MNYKRTQALTVLALTMRRAPLRWYEFLDEPELNSACKESWEKMLELGDANALILVDKLHMKENS